MIQDKANTPAAARFGWSDLFEAWGGLAALVGLAAFCALFPATREHFLNPENIRNIIHQNAFIGIIAVGMTFVIISGGIDLSVGSMAALIGGLSILAMNQVIGLTESPVGVYPPIKYLIGANVSEGLGVVCACAVAPPIGMALGLLNGVLITKGRIAPFIVTLGGFAGYRSIILAIADGGEVRSGSFSLFEAVSSPRHGIPLPAFEFGERTLELYITWPIIVFLLIAIVGQVALSHTRFGRYVIAVGSNETAARYSAINIDRVRMVAYALIGLCTGVAAVLLASRLNSVGASNTGNLFELDAIAAVVIGGTRMSGGRGRIWGTVCGVLILGIIDNMLLLAEVSAYWQGLVKAGVILLAVLLQRSRPA